VSLQKGYPEFAAFAVVVVGAMDFDLVGVRPGMLVLVLDFPFDSSVVMVLSVVDVKFLA